MRSILRPGAFALFHFSTFPLLNFPLNSDALRLRHPSSPRIAVVFSVVCLLCGCNVEAGAPVAWISGGLGLQRRAFGLLDSDRMGEPRRHARISEQRDAHEGDAQTAAMVR